MTTTDPQRLTFTAVAAIVAKERGCRLERGDETHCRGARSGFILWKRGLWRQYKTLQAVLASSWLEEQIADE